MLEFKDFKRMNLEELLIFENFHLDWQRQNYAQRCNQTATEAFELVKIVTKYLDVDNELDDIFDLTILHQYEGNYLEILD